MNSSDALAAVEHFHSPLSTGRAAAAAPGRSIFATSPRDGGIELSAAGAGGAGSRASGASTPLAGGAGAAAALAKKHTSASVDGTAGETALLLDRGQQDGGGGGGPTGVHQRASATGGSSSSTPNGLSQLGAFAASVRSRLVT